MSDAAVVLINPKFGHNVGGAIRAATAFGASDLRWTGERVSAENKRMKGHGRLPREERMRAYRGVNYKQVPESRVLQEFLDRGMTPVAVEVREEFESLAYFEHPEQAVYVFGPEDSGVHRGVLTACHRFVYIPTHTCLNLSAAVNVVLYDRRLKAQLNGNEPVVPLSEMMEPSRAGELRNPKILAGYEGR